MSHSTRTEMDDHQRLVKRPTLSIPRLRHY